MLHIFKSVKSSKIMNFQDISAKLHQLGTQSRAISITRMTPERATGELEQNPYYSRYAQQITEFHNASPEEFRDRLRRYEERKRQASRNTASASTPLAGHPGEAKSQPTTLTKPKLLSDVMKLDLIEGKSADDIKEIWVEYHKSKDCIAAAVPMSKFDMIQSKGDKFPIFLLPLPRNQGYEFIMCQFSGNEVHFTPLISYQTHKENAPECLTIIYYPDLKDSKGLVLMRGEFNKDVLTVVEAQCLANELQLYYGEENEKRTRLLERFSNNPEEFKHMDLIANLETLSF